jgi:hypothetical protein
MKALAALIFGATAFTACATAAAESDYSDIDVVAVAPRSVDLKPFVMASPAEKPIPKSERQAIAEKIAKLLASGAMFSTGNAGQPVMSAR